MGCFTLRGPDGDRLIAENENYRLGPGEAIVPGLITWNCGPQASGGTDPLKDLIHELDKELTGEVGNWIKVFAKPVAKALGKANCMSCEVRRVIGNAYGDLANKYGKAKAFSIVVDLVKKSAVNSELDVLMELKECLNVEQNGQSLQVPSS